MGDTSWTARTRIEKGSLRRKAWTAFWQKALNSGVDRRDGHLEAGHAVTRTSQRMKGMASVKTDTTVSRNLGEKQASWVFSTPTNHCL